MRVSYACSYVCVCVCLVFVSAAQKAFSLAVRKINQNRFKSTTSVADLRYVTACVCASVCILCVWSKCNQFICFYASLFYCLSVPVPLFCHPAPLNTACNFVHLLSSLRKFGQFSIKKLKHTQIHTLTHTGTHSHTHTYVIRQGVGTYNLFFNEKDNVYVMGNKRGCDGVERDSCGQFGNTETQWGTGTGRGRGRGTQGDGQTMSQWKWHKCLIQDIWIFHKDMTHIQNKARASPKNDYNVPQWVCAYVCECVWISAGNRILLLSCR